MKKWPGYVLGCGHALPEHGRAGLSGELEVSLGGIQLPHGKEQSVHLGSSCNYFLSGLNLSLLSFLYLLLRIPYCLGDANK